MTEEQAKAIVSKATGYSVDESRAVVLEMAQNLGLDLLEAVKTLGGVPAARFR